MHREQRGLTLIGWLILLTPLAIVLYGAIRLTPVYLNYVKVARALEQVASELQGEEAVNLQRIRLGIERRLNVESVSFPTVNDFVIRRDGQAWVVQAAYEDAAPLFANLSLLVTFDKSVRIE